MSAGSGITDLPQSRVPTQTLSGPGGDLFIDVIRAGHVSTSSQQLLQQRRLIWNKDYGWVYDVWVDNPASAAFAGANGRFSMPGIAAHLGRLAAQGGDAAREWQTRLFR